MRFRFGRKAAAATATSASASSSSNKTAAPASCPLAAGAEGTDSGGIASPDHYGTESGGSKDELFFEARPWLDSDSEDDLQSVRGDFTPSRGSTPDHQMQFASFAARISMDRLNPSLIEKKQRLLELLQEKQQYDDEHDGTIDAGSEMGMNGIVHAEEKLKSPGEGESAKKSSRTGCLPYSVWKFTFKSCWKKKNEQKD